MPNTDDPVTRAGRSLDAVIFDLGGVLLDWDPRYLYRKLFDDPAEMERFLTGVCSDEWQREHDLGVDIEASCQLRAALYPEYEDMIMAWLKRGEEMVAGQFDATVDILADLKAGGIPCYALSNMGTGAFALRRARFPFMEWFDGWVISGIEKVAKPDIRIFQILMERYRVTPQKSIFIDDSARNVAAARGLGMTVVHFTSPAQLRADLHDRGLVRAGH